MPAAARRSVPAAPPARPAPSLASVGRRALGARVFAASALAANTLAVAGAAGCTRQDAGRGPARAAAGDAPVSGGTVLVATASEPTTLLPPLAATPNEQAVVDQLFERLADPGDSLNLVGDAGFRPRLARRWTWTPDSLSITFVLDSAARWHDGTPVTARDVAFSFRTYADPALRSPVATRLANIDSVTTADSLRAVVWFARRYPEQFADAVRHVYVLPEHRLGPVRPAAMARDSFARAPLGAGRFRLDGWTRGSQLTLAADTDHPRGRPRLDAVVWRFSPDFGAATIALLGGEADFVDALRLETLAQLRGSRDVRLVPYPSLEYGFLAFNLGADDGSGRPHPLFADRELRRALTLGVDRERIVRAVFDTLARPGIGPLPRAVFPGWRDVRPLPHDAARARALLDSLGWRAGADGARTRDGVPLAFSILVPTTTGLRERAAALVEAQLEALGARVTIERVDITAFVERQRTRRFDAALGGWRVDPSPGGIRQTWGTPGSRGRGGSNYGGYASRQFDAQVDSALNAADAARSRTQWVRAVQTILDDAPAIWLFEPTLVAGAHRRVQLPALRPDGWWLGLADWWIPAGQRIGRDRLGL
jgi:peptide/nickel transport system substrate-binding protein